jgi:hypothetical protein
LKGLTKMDRSKTETKLAFLQDISRRRLTADRLATLVDEAEKGSGGKLGGKAELPGPTDEPCPP